MLGRRYVHCIIRIYFKRTWCWSISGSCGIRKCIKQTTNYQELRLLGINLHVWKANQLPKTDIASLRRASTWAWNPQKWRWEHHFSVNDLSGKLIVYLFGFWKTDLGIYIYIIYTYTLYMSSSTLVVCHPIVRYPRPRRMDGHVSISCTKRQLFWGWPTQFTEKYQNQVSSENDIYIYMCVLIGIYLYTQYIDI